MGTLYQEPLENPNTNQDLKVTIQDSSMVYPSQQTESRSMFLSNIDKVLSFNVRTLHFFAAHPEFPPETAAKKLRKALSKVLVFYDYLSGRLKPNPELGRLEIDCNGAGVVFVVASSDYTLNEIGDLVYPNPAFRQLIVQDDYMIPYDDHQLLCIFQVTSFKCGGFAMGVSTNHVTFDGTSFKTFLQNLASQAFDNKPLAVTPCNDRKLLAARSPPRVTFPHPELLKLKPSVGEDSPDPTIFDCPNDELSSKIFRLSSSEVAHLKEKAMSPDGKAVKVTGFNVVSAHVWRCKALSSCDDNLDYDRESTLLYAVDIRPRLQPPLPRSYSGNAVLSAYATLQCRELMRGPLSKIVEAVAEGSARITDEYARSAIDWGEKHKGFPHGDFMISSWWRLGFAEVEYPWGRPKYSCPVVYHRKDIILLFPDFQDPVTKNNDNNGVNVLVALPPLQMDKFENLFYEFLA